MGTRFHDQRARLKVIEIELELAFLVARIEWRGRAPRRHADERAGRERAVREHYGDTIRRIHSRAAQLATHVAGLAAKGPIGKRGPARGANGVRMFVNGSSGRAGTEKVHQRLQQPLPPNARNVKTA